LNHILSVLFTLIKKKNILQFHFLSVNETKMKMIATNCRIKFYEKSKYSQTKQIHNAYCIMLPHHFKPLQLLVYVFKKHTSLTIYYNCKREKKVLI